MSETSSGEKLGPFLVTQIFAVKIRHLLVARGEEADGKLTSLAKAIRAFGGFDGGEADFDFSKVCKNLR